jgi:predicted nucleic acid-binding protein
MIRRIFVDSDIIFDLLLARQPFFPAATELFLAIQNKQVEAWASPLIFSNLFYILRKALSAPEAIAALRKLRLLVRLLPVDERTTDLALASSFTDFEDAIQYYAAVSGDLDALVTRNKQDYRSAELPILTAAECVALLSSEDG